MKLLKNIVTVIFVLVCCFVIFVSALVYFEETSDMEYALPYRIQMEMEDANLSYIGESYGVYSRDNYGYYRLTVFMNNETNVGIDEYSVYLKYRATDEISGYRITEIEQDGTEEILTEREYFPAGKQAVCYRILEIPDGCLEFDLIYTIASTGDEQTIHIFI